MTSRTDRLLMIAGALLSISTVAWTSPGVVNLSQPQQTPIVINQPGSYQLISNLTSSGPEDDVIHIDADNVTIDLNGFTIFPGLHAAGITSTSTGGHSNIVIKDGSLTGALGGEFGGGAGGIIVGANSTIRDVNLTSTGLNLVCGDNCIIDHVVRTPGPEGQNGGLVPGMMCGSSCQIHSVIVAFVGSGSGPALGLSCQAGCLLTDSIFNQGNVTLGTGSSYARNTFSGGATVAGGVNAGQNVCNGAICP